VGSRSCSWERCGRGRNHPRERGNGRKRHIVVDTLGLLLTVMVTAASVTDREAGRTLLARLRERHWRITLVWADGGYTGHLVDLARDAASG